MSIAYLSRYECGVCGKYHKNGSKAQAECEKTENLTPSDEKAYANATQSSSSQFSQDTGSGNQNYTNKRRRQ